MIFGGRRKRSWTGRRGPIASLLNWFRLASCGQVGMRVIESIRLDGKDAPKRQSENFSDSVRPEKTGARKILDPCCEHTTSGLLGITEINTVRIVTLKRVRLKPNFSGRARKNITFLHDLSDTGHSVTFSPELCRGQ